MSEDHGNADSMALLAARILTPCRRGRERVNVATQTDSLRLAVRRTVRLGLVAENAPGPVVEFVLGTYQVLGRVRAQICALREVGAFVVVRAAARAAAVAVRERSRRASQVDLPADLFVLLRCGRCGWSPAGHRVL